MPNRRSSRRCSRFLSKRRGPRASDFRDDCLKLALRLFNAAQFESSLRARLLLLVTVLEVLAERSRRTGELSSALVRPIDLALSSHPTGFRDALTRGLA
jgi:hypothetical protein